MQIGFSRLWDGYVTDAEAKKARDARYREEVRKGNDARRWTLRNQVKKYDGLGQPNGSSCTVFMLDIRIAGR